MALAIALGNLTRHLSRWLDLLPVFLCLVVVIPSLLPSMLARPHILALPVKDDDTLPNILAQYHVKWAMLEPDLPVTRRMGHMPGWRQIYADKTAVVFTRGP